MLLQAFSTSDGARAKSRPITLRNVGILAALITASVVGAATDAQACHKFRYWRYPFPQRCYIARVIPRPVAIFRPAALAKFPIPVPALTYVQWTSSDDTPIRLILLGIGRSRIAGESQ